MRHQAFKMINSQDMKKIVTLLIALMTVTAVIAQKNNDGRICHKGDGSFIVISKETGNENLRVYSGDSTLLIQFPACLSKVKGNKQRVGDMKTPESPAGKPFSISMIQNASTWKHDFKDGRGNIKAYGRWFMRLNTPGHSGIGIHGSTNNENTVPGRASEGCIRLLDKDIITLTDKYAYVGMKVVIKHEGESLYPWEPK